MRNESANSLSIDFQKNHFAVLSVGDSAWSIPSLLPCKMNYLTVYRTIFQVGESDYA
jgi:hypothetical protein